jgi:putative membrane protein
MMYGYTFPMLGGAVMTLFCVLVVVAIVWAVVSVSRNTGQRNATQPRSKSPFDVLKRRYATGEINKEQFEEMTHNLGV